MILEGKNLSKDLKLELTDKVKKLLGDNKKYVGIIYLGDDYSSATYVKHKKKYGEDIGLPVIVFGQNNIAEYDRNQASGFDDVGIYINQNYDNIYKLMELIKYLNYDNDCVGILVQMPLPEQFEKYREQILTAVSPDKDVDGLGGVITGLSSAGLIDFVPATPKAVFYLLEQYKLDNFVGKTVSVLGQGDVSGKPIVMECIKRGATVFSCNIDTPIEQIKKITRESDYIICCTGKVHLVDSSFVSSSANQVIVDVGYGHIDGKPVGDVNIDDIADNVGYYTPVPGGVGPLTVACIFDNVLNLWDRRDVLKSYKL